MNMAKIKLYLDSTPPVKLPVFLSMVPTVLARTRFWTLLFSAVHVHITSGTPSHQGNPTKRFLKKLVSGASSIWTKSGRLRFSLVYHYSPAYQKFKRTSTNGQNPPGYAKGHARGCFCF